MSGNLFLEPRTVITLAGVKLREAIKLLSKTLRSTPECWHAALEHTIGVPLSSPSASSHELFSKSRHALSPLPPESFCFPLMTKHTGHPIQRPVATGPDELNLVLVGRMALSPDCHATARSQLVLVAVSAALCHSDLGRLCLLLNQLLIPLSTRFDLGFGFDRTFIFGELLQNGGLPTSGVQSFRLCAVLSDTCCVCFGCRVLHSSLADVEPCRGGRGTSLKDSPPSSFCVRLAFDSFALRRNTTALDSRHAYGRPL